MASIIDQVKQKIDIVDVVSTYLDLQKKGKNYWGICPFHQDNHPSMSVSPERQMFKCFVCGKGGSVIDFVSAKEQIPFGLALEKLAKQIGLEYQQKFVKEPKYNEQQQKLIDALNDANNFFQYQILASPPEDLSAYLKKRKLNQELCEKFSIGYAPNDQELITFLQKKGHDEATLINASLITEQKRVFFRNRLMFALKNEFGDVVAFAGRLLGKSGPKYLNSSESQVFSKTKMLYNFDKAGEIITHQKEVIICEGFMDVIALTKAKHSNALALMGTTLSKFHLNKLKDMSITLMLDGDKAGINASLKSIKLLLYHHFTTYVAVSQTKQDPDEIYHTLGEDGIDQLLATKVSALDFVYQWEKNNFNLKSPDGIEQFVKAFVEYLTYANNLEKDFYLNQIAKDFNLTKSVIAPMIPNHQSSNITLPKILPAKPKWELAPKNYAYILIRSMLAKPILIDLFKEQKVDFNNQILNEIGKYLIAIRNNQKVKILPKYQQPILQIKNESSEKVSTEKAFLEVIDLINKQTKTNLIELFNVKLNKASTETERLKWLRLLKQVQKGEGK